MRMNLPFHTGDLVGSAVFPASSNTVGLTVGFNVGLQVGFSVGESEGLSVG